ncbi:hypothetical protein [Dactylosporangium sp. CA-139066]|uniref:hypothetical protein n=1 Tax=Dactylosporangium sp. CA-139066 TaxID=3239930 RepID=UPI003D8CAF0D
MSGLTGWARAGAYAAVALTAIACGDLVNHDDERPRRSVPVAALYLDDGHPTVLLAPCEHTRVIEVTVVDNSAHKIWTAVDSDPADPATTVRVFAVPPGWTLEKHSAADFTELTPGHDYRLFTSLYSLLESSTRDSAPNFTFTPADLTALKPDQVWTVAGESSPPQATPRTEFQRAASAACGTP